PLEALLGDARLPREDEDEAPYVERERQDPEERDGAHVGRDMGRHSQHEAGGDGREGDPARLPRERDRRRGGRGERGDGWALAARREDAAGSGEDDEERVAGRPELALPLDAGQGLERERVAEEPDHAPEVARAVEEVGILRRFVVGAREPGLEERSTRRDGEEGEPDRD